MSVRVQQMYSGQPKTGSSNLIVTINTNKTVKSEEYARQYVEVIRFFCQNILGFLTPMGTNLPLSQILVAPVDVNFNAEIGSKMKRLHSHITIRTLQRTGYVHFNKSLAEAFLGDILGFPVYINIGVDKGHSEAAKNYLRK